MTDEHQDPFEVERETQAEPEAVEAPTRRPEATGVAWGAIVAFAGIALIIVFAVQNTDPVPVRFLWMEGEHPLAIVILITVGAVILLTELIGVSYRRRRRRRRDEKEELRRLRDA
ncbi:MAG TPA: LapA family protein [Acidimicrobiia bacterium]|nr:LapA family protein [Acidimicrobiia bacterium]